MNIMSRRTGVVSGFSIRYPSSSSGPKVKSFPHVKVVIFVVGCFFFPPLLMSSFAGRIKMQLRLVILLVCSHLGCFVLSCQGDPYSSKSFSSNNFGPEIPLLFQII